jgi:hypothetical protein
MSYQDFDHRKAKAQNNCWVTDERSTFWWPYCIIEGCLNRQCRRLNSLRCYPHTLPGVPLPGDLVETKDSAVTVAGSPDA